MYVRMHTNSVQQCNSAYFFKHKKLKRMESIRSITEAVISTILKNEGFTAVDNKALDLFTTSILNYTVYTSAWLKKQCELSRRTSPTLVDASCLMQEINTTAKQHDKSSLVEILDKFNSDPLTQLEIEEEVSSDTDHEFISEACAQVEYPQNYYDFLPKLPPAHTFKNSAIKRKITDDRAQKARIRNEQIKQVVENLFSIMVKNKKSPGYANYLM
ncbi:hypothetical protein NEQG_01253 [Nematocida parisii ERTm3]|uniref:Transcription initiation factor TFIID subunit 8 n=1 Tax=Nematocida parisii (strain ERTm3) TaxID=935791 RepID=I3EH66_NEMP3|nr:hypothetical protein NEQG_01253 [Nematocida parisii ERTm3]